MKQLLIIFGMMWCVTLVHAQDDWEWTSEVSNVKAKVSLLEDGETWVIIPDSNVSKRYISRQLPEEYKKNGLAITFNGWIGKIPPHIRMLGTPLKITKIWVSCADKKKYKLKQGKYIFK